MSARPEPPSAVAGRAPEDSRRSGPDTTLPAALILVALTAVWTWWAWEEGAFFDVVFYPGAIGLCVVLLVCLPAVPWCASLRLSRGAAVALIGLVVLGCWTLLSMLWSPAPDEALSDGGRVLLYALSFALGLWLCHLLGRRMLLSLLPLAVAGGVAGVATAVTVLTLSGDDLHRYVEIDGTLSFPLGYRNANAAFFLIALWPAVSLAATPQVDWRLRGVMLGCAALCVEIAMLCQSRGSILASGPALFAWLLVSPWRLRGLAWLGLALVPAAVALPWLINVYETAKGAEVIVSATGEEVFSDGREDVLAALGDAGWAMIFATAGAIVVGGIAARLEPAPRHSPTVERPLTRALATGAGVALVGAVAVFGATGTDPVDWVGQRAAEFRKVRDPDLSAQSTRFSTNLASRRPDLWRVAWEDAREEPLIGKGAGAFQYTYLRERRERSQAARDAHSVELELASELGFPALAMFGAVAVGGVAAALRSRRLGPAHATLSAAALATGAYWLVHTSIEWFWTYPALTAPVFGLLGTAAAGAVFDRERSRANRGRLAVGLVAIAAAALAVPPYLSERYTNDAYHTWGSDLGRAYDDLDAAEKLNPFSEEPLLAEGSIAMEAGDRERAAGAFREAIERRPEEWASYYFLGRLLAKDDPSAAAEELAIADRLYPRSDVVRRALARVNDRGPDQP
jgi:tetratricopeptide (TPR) repeat protein